MPDWLVQDLLASLKAGALAFLVGVVWLLLVRLFKLDNRRVTLYLYMILLFVTLMTVRIFIGY